MSTNTDKLGLILNEGTDPFKRDDFVENWQTLDNHPGYFLCTSTTRPAWGPEQIGMLIYETDTRRMRYFAGAGVFKSVHDYPTMYRGSVSGDVAKGKNESHTYLLKDNLVIIRPCALYMTFTLMASHVAATPFRLDVIQPRVGATDVGYGQDAQLYLPDGPSGTTKNYRLTTTVTGYYAAAPGTYDINLYVHVANDADITQDGTLNFAKVFIQLAEPDADIA